MGIPYGDYLVSNGHVAIDWEKAIVLRRHKIATRQNAEASQFCIE